MGGLTKFFFLSILEALGLAIFSGFGKGVAKHIVRYSQEAGGSWLPPSGLR